MVSWNSNYYQRIRKKKFLEENYSVSEWSIYDPNTGNGSQLSYPKPFLGIEPGSLDSHPTLLTIIPPTHIHLLHSTSFSQSFFPWQQFSCGKENIINKIRKADGALCMIRHYVPFTMLRSIYFSLFQPHIHYGLQIWGQNLCPISRINRLQRIAVRLITFSVFNAPSKPLFMLAKIPTVFRLCVPT